ncbi:MAG: hypothetical protein JW888_18645, partial [Pirellulales bacterium]|nr:hypothetical protein [Pirellulales bacterium]
MDEPTKPPSLTTEQIDARLKQIEEMTGLEEPIKQKVLGLYEKVKKELQLTKRLRSRRDTYDTEARDAEKSLEDAESQRRALAAQPPIATVEEVPLDKLRPMLTKAEAELRQFQDELIDARGELRRRKQRRAEIPSLSQSARQRLAEINAQLKSQPATNENELVREARADLLRTRAVTFQEEIAGYQSELAAYEATSPLVPLRRDLAALRVRLAEAKVKALRDAERAKHRSAIVRQIEQAQEDLRNAPPAVSRWAKNNATLSKERETLNVSMEKAVDDLLEAEGTLAGLTRQHQRIEEQIEMVGLTNAVGRLLRDQRIVLPDLQDCQKNVKQRQQQQTEICARLLELEEWQEQLGDMDRHIQDVLGTMETTDADRAERLARLLHTQKQYLDELIREYNDYYEEIVDLESAELQLIEETEAFSQLIEEHVLWIRTSRPLASSTLRQAGNALTWLVRWKTWAEVGQSLAASPTAMPLVWLLAMLFFLPLLFFRTRMKRAVDQIGNYAAKGGAQRFLPTAEVFVLTVLLAIPWPGLAWFLAACLSASDPLTGDVKAIAHGLSATALVAFPIELLRQVCRRNGLAEIHFGWPVTAMAQFRRRLNAFVLLGLPPLFVMTTLHNLADERWGWDSSLGRGAFLVFMAIVAVFGHRVLRPSGIIVREFVAQHPDGWLARMRRFWYFAGTLSPVLLILLTLFGY